MKFARLAGAAALAVIAAGAAQAQIKLALDSPPDPENAGGYVWATAFADHMNANGMETTLFQRGALGEEAERLDQVSAGLLEVSMSAVKTAGSLDKLIFGVYLPYLFKDVAGLDHALGAGGMMARINAGTTPKGVRVLAFQAVGRPTGIFNTRHPVESLADMADLRMRALDETQIALFKAWGATGTIVSWAEVPNALQTGVADGYLNPPFVPLLFGHADFIKYFTDAAVSPSMRIVIASEDWYQGLSAEQRAIVDEAASKATAANREWLEGRAGILDKLAAAGIAVTRLSEEERAKFEQASSAVYMDGALSPEQVALWLAAAGR